LSDRQIEMLSWAARGLLDREIAETVGLAHQTVRHHLQATRVKLKARNTTHAVAIALVQNIITLEDRS
jgi:DNA-binding CsgD family transcriptional regulator